MSSRCWCWCWCCGFLLPALAALGLVFRGMAVKRVVDANAEAEADAPRPSPLPLPLPLVVLVPLRAPDPPMLPLLLPRALATSDPSSMRLPSCRCAWKKGEPTDALTAVMILCAPVDDDVPVPVCGAKAKESEGLGVKLAMYDAGMGIFSIMIYVVDGACGC